MWTRIAVAGAVTAGIVGVGAVALADTGSGSTPGTGRPATSAGTHPGKPAAAGRVGGVGGVGGKDFQHGEWVTRVNGQDVTHDAIRGTVTDVTSGAITAQSADNVTLTFTANGSTKVLLRQGGKGSAKQGAIGDVKKGDTVLVTGTKAGSVLTAQHILDTGTK
jgi:hypothetical protein